MRQAYQTLRRELSLSFVTELNVALKGSPDRPYLLFPPAGGKD